MTHGYQSARCVRLLLVTAFAAWLGEAATAQDFTSDVTESGLTLREKTLVDDALVRLGDLFVETLDDPDIPVAEAPAPGHTLILDSRRLRHIAEAYGLNWRPASKLQRVEVSRLSQRITPEQIESAAMLAVVEAARSSADLRIRFDGALTGFDLPTDVDATVALRDLRYDPFSRRFAGNLVAPADGAALYQQPISGTVTELVEIPVPSRLISAGETITGTDLEWIPIEVERVSNFHLTDAAQVIGQVAKRPLRAGQPMRSTDVALAPLIKKNGLVRLIVASGPMTLTVRARALEDGVYGQAVRVVNVDSNRQVLGVVQDAGTVTVAGDDLAASN